MHLISLVISVTGEENIGKSIDFMSSLSPLYCNWYISVLLLAFRWPANALPCRAPLLVIEGSLVDEALVLVQVSSAPNNQDTKDGNVKRELAEKALLLVHKASSGDQINEASKEVPNHGGAAVELLGLQVKEQSSCFSWTAGLCSVTRVACRTCYSDLLY